MMILLHTHCSRIFCSGIVLSRNLWWQCRSESQEIQFHVSRL
jgi:hypothetical protein